MLKNVVSVTSPSPAHLNEQQDDYLAERGELRVGVKYHKARHAGGGGSGEHGVQHVQHLSVPVGDGQHQQQRAAQDNGKKAADDQPGRVGVFAPGVVGKRLGQRKPLQQNTSFCVFA